jgi:hypothetical protein
MASHASCTPDLEQTQGHEPGGNGNVSVVPGISTGAAGCTEPESCLTMR